MKFILTHSTHKEGEQLSTLVEAAGFVPNGDWLVFIDEEQRPVSMYNASGVLKVERSTVA
jgi:hypothetical protein